MRRIRSEDFEVHSCTAVAEIKMIHSLIRFQCTYFVDWTTPDLAVLTASPKRFQTAQNVALMNERLTITPDLLFNKGSRLYQSKRTLLRVNLVSKNKSSTPKLFGLIYVDLAEILNTNCYAALNEKKLESCTPSAGGTISFRIIATAQLTNKNPQDLEMSMLSMTSNSAENQASSRVQLQSKNPSRLDSIKSSSSSYSANVLQKKWLFPENNSREGSSSSRENSAEFRFLPSGQPKVKQKDSNEPLVRRIQPLDERYTVQPTHSGGSGKNYPHSQSSRQDNSSKGSSPSNDTHYRQSIPQQENGETSYNLKQQIASLREQIKSYIEQNGQLRVQCMQFETITVSMDERLKKLNEQHFKCRQVRRNLQEQMATVERGAIGAIQEQAKINELTHQMKNAADREDGLRRQIVSQQATLKDVWSHVSQLQQQNQSIRASSSQLEHYCSEARLEVDRLKNDKFSLEWEINKLRQDKMTNSQHRALSQSFEQLHQQIDRLNVEGAGLKRQLNELRIQRDQIQSTLKEEKLIVEKHQLELSQAKLQNHTQTSSVKRLTNQNSQLQLQNANLNEELSNLRQKLIRQDEHSHQIINQLALSAMAASHQSQMRQLDAKYQEDISGLEQVIRQTESLLERQTKKSKDAQALYEEQVKRLSEQRNNLIGLQEINSNLQTQVQTLNTQNIKLEEETKSLEEFLEQNQHNSQINNHHLTQQIIRLGKEVENLSNDRDVKEKRIAFLQRLNKSLIDRNMVLQEAQEKQSLLSTSTLIYTKGPISQSPPCEVQNEISENMQSSRPHHSPLDCSKVTQQTQADTYSEPIEALSLHFAEVIKLLRLVEVEVNESPIKLVRLSSGEDGTNRQIFVVEEESAQENQSSQITEKVYHPANQFNLTDKVTNNKVNQTEQSVEKNYCQESHEIKQHIEHNLRLASQLEQQTKSSSNQIDNLKKQLNSVLSLLQSERVQISRMRGQLERVSKFEYQAIVKEAQIHLGEEMIRTKEQLLKREQQKNEALKGKLQEIQDKLQKYFWQLFCHQQALQLSNETIRAYLEQINDKDEEIFVRESAIQENIMKADHYKTQLINVLKQRSQQNSSINIKSHKYCTEAKIKNNVESSPVRDSQSASEQAWKHPTVYLRQSIIDIHSISEQISFAVKRLALQGKQAVRTHQFKPNQGSERDQVNLIRLLESNSKRLVDQAGKLIDHWATEAIELKDHNIQGV